MISIFKKPICRILTCICLLNLSSLAVKDSTADSFLLEVTTHMGDHQHFRAGEKISFLASTSKKSYLLMVYHDAAGHLIQILPNRSNADNHFAAGDFFSIPDNNDAYVFEVQAPYGRETLYTYAFSTPAPVLAGKALANGFKILDGEWKNISKKLETFESYLAKHSLNIITGP